MSGRYRIVRKLGMGGMGTVFLAEQIHLGDRLVAIKVLRRNLADDPDFLQRFREEAASTGRIRHQNVVTVYECGQSDDGSTYVAMEYLEGETLRQSLKTRGAIGVGATAEILKQAARGLGAAHKLSIIHRDLKPDNLFLTHDDVGQVLVKVVEFGIAKMRESSTHTMTGLTIGTPAYMSFEQASGMRSEELDARSDIYTLGIVVYEMLSGRVPFEAQTPLGCVRKHLVETPPPFSKIRPGLEIPAAVERVVMKALAKEREQRHATVSEFAMDFAQAANPEPTRAEVPGAVANAEAWHGAMAKHQDVEVPSGAKAQIGYLGWSKGIGVAALGILVVASLAWWGMTRSPRLAQRHDALPASAPALPKAVPSTASAQRVQAPQPHPAQVSAEPLSKREVSGKATEPAPRVNPTPLAVSKSQQSTKAAKDALG